MEINIEGLTDEQMQSVQKLVQSETDKVRTDYSMKLKGVNEELSKYKPAEKSQMEIEFEQRLKALEDKERELNLKERSNAISSKLKEKGLPEELSKFITVGENLEEDIDNIATALGGYFLQGNYKPESHANNKGITKEQFKKMSYMERTKLFQENPELFNSLAK